MSGGPSTEFEVWANANCPSLLEDSQTDAEKTAKLGARHAWQGGAEEMLGRAANVCRNAAQAYTARGRHSGTGWQLSVYLEREIRALVDRAHDCVPTSPQRASEYEVLTAPVCSDARKRGEVGPAPESPLPRSSQTLENDDSRFLMCWVLGWIPTMCLLFLVLMPRITVHGDMTLTGAAVLVFVYFLFAPALYRLFLNGRPGSRTGF